MKRGYISAGEAADMAGVDSEVITDALMERAEELIDSYVGYQEKYFDDEIMGKCVEGTKSTLRLQAMHQNIYWDGYLAGCLIEIISGTNAGESKIITDSAKGGVITVDSEFTNAIDSTSYYRIVQAGKFPRFKDVFNDSINHKVIKVIPLPVRRATGAQIEYLLKMGDAFFSTDKPEMNSETIGDYSYSRGSNGSGGSIEALIAPKAKLLLKGYRNRKGVLIA